MAFPCAHILGDFILGKSSGGTICQKHTLSPGSRMNDRCENERQLCPAFSNTKAAEQLYFLQLPSGRAESEDPLSGNHSQAGTTQPFLHIWDPFTTATFSGSPLRLGLWVESRSRCSPASQQFRTEWGWFPGNKYALGVSQSSIYLLIHNI